MEQSFFALRKHWMVALCATALSVGAVALKPQATSSSTLLIQIGVLILFIQFVWSGAFGIAALLSGKKSHFFQLLLLSLYCIIVLTLGVVCYLNH
jgi:hypothetical protein